MTTRGKLVCGKTEEGIVKAGSFNIDRGVGIRAVHGEKQAFAYSDDITLNALTEAANAARAMVRRSAGRRVGNAVARFRCAMRRCGRSIA